MQSSRPYGQLCVDRRGGRGTCFSTSYELTKGCNGIYTDESTVNTLMMQGKCSEGR